MQLILRLIISALLFSSSAFAVGSPNFIPDGPHPRIWLTSSELSRLSTIRDAGNVKWTTLESWCDSHIADAGYNTAPPDPVAQDLTMWDGNNSYTGYRMSGWASHLYSFALAYQVLKQPGSAQNTTKAATYAARAKVLMIDGIATALRAGEENNGIRAVRVAELHDQSINLAEATALGIPNPGYKNGYSARNLMAVPIAYDWIYDTLSSGEKTQLTSMMLRWSDWSLGIRSAYNNGVLISGTRYHEDQNGDCTGLNNCTSKTGTATQGFDVTSVSGNFGGGFASMISLIGVATYGDYSESVDNYQSIKTYLNTYFVNPLGSDIGQSGGDSVEGWGYSGGYYYLAPALYGFYTATGDSAISEMPWFNGLVRSALHRTSGNFLSIPMYGYWSSAPFKVNRIEQISKFVGIAQKIAPTSDESKMGQFLLNTPTYSGSLLAWEDLFYTDSSITPASPDSTSEPKSYVSTGNGLYMSRSSWDDAQTIAITSRLEGKWTTSHEGLDEGHISLLRGTDVLLAHQNIGDVSASVSFNTIVFNSISHQTNNPAQSEPSIDRYAENSTFSYVSGDITNAWKRPYRANMCELFRRSLLHIRPGIIVVYDVTRSNSALGNLKEWYTQYEADPTISGDTITVTNGSSRAFVKSLYPSGSFTETNPATGYYRVKYVPTSTQEYDQFLHVIDVGSSTSNQTSATLITGTGGRGALIGTTAVMFTDNQDGEVINSLSYSTNATTHYIADLPISANVEVFRDGSSLGTFNTGSAGIITFSATSGDTTYTIGNPVGAVLPTSFRIPGGVPYGIVP